MAASLAYTLFDYEGDYKVAPLSTAPFVFLCGVKQHKVVRNSVACSETI